jgi:hypothetical protein
LLDKSREQPQKDHLGHNFKRYWTMSIVLKTGRVSWKTDRLADTQEQPKQRQKAQKVVVEVVDDSVAEQPRRKSARTSPQTNTLKQERVKTRHERMGEIAEVCISEGKTNTMQRRRFGRSETVKIFYDAGVQVRESEFVTVDGASVGRTMWLDGKRPVGTVVGEYLGNVERAKDWVPNGYTVELSNERVLNCLSFSSAPVCIASMANDAVGLTHRTTGASARQNCLIVAFDEYPGRVFIVARLTLEDEELFVDYGAKFFNTCMQV